MLTIRAIANHWKRFPMFLAALAAVVPSWGQPVVEAVLNGASYSGNIAPGTWVSIFGTQLSPSTTTASGLPLQTSLGGVSVTFNGMPAPLYYISATQINAVVPFELTVPLGMVLRGVPVVVTTPAGASAPLNISLSRESPGIFTLNGQGTGTAIAFDVNFNPVTVVTGGPIVLYADGLGPTNPPASSASGGATTAPFNQVVDNLTVFIGDTPATVLFAGLAPGFPGIYQLNVMPNGPISDRVYLQIGGWQSNIVSLPITAGSNVSNASGTISSLYPPATGPVNNSALLIAGTFSVDFDLQPFALPFSILAASDSGATVIAINPGAGTWQATVTVVTPAAEVGNLSSSGFALVWDFLTCVSDGSCSPFPNNEIPESLLDPKALQAMNMLPQETSPLAGSPNALFSASGTLSGTHVSIGPSSDLANFGGFLQIPEVGPASRNASFSLYVDGALIASSSASYSVVQP
jgi:uncharacterized protein (TIGR03437 family)